MQSLPENKCSPSRKTLQPVTAGMKRKAEVLDQQQHEVNQENSRNTHGPKAKRHKDWRKKFTSNTLGTQISPSLVSRKSFQLHKKYERLELYPNIKKANQKYTRKPTAEEVKNAYKIISDPKKWKLFDRGLNILFDKSRKDRRVIAIIEFVEWDELTVQERIEINHVSTFLHSSKRFLTPVKARGWGGYMWALGYRKAMVKGQIFGRYIKQVAMKTAPKLFDSVFRSSAWVGSILGNMFENMGSIPFKKNQETMKENGIPDFAALSFTDKSTNSSGSPHITFTSNGFFNPPHTDKKDISDFAFALFVPTFKSTGKLASPSDGCKITRGPFVFPDYRAGIDFSRTTGIVRMIWRARDYKHCTLPHEDNPFFTRLAMSLQINKNLSNACLRFKKGVHKGKIIADHYYYLNKVLQRRSSKRRYKK
ncbi:hypothetical protein PTTG_25730 [Puccinia triticina 1-1 BBBD Race 1]|uniref:Tet-like 2OG-Fe(II) oxygenase domain-containing protein n=2 Tax=Puccinia triticina TaxID=208348 RepID=A0A180H0G9_PUCT1|nr:uncharacterized protein PtA15_8A410 [Puccinia triticina]OAV98284.1 hypothetical protein PTTG_25730 [Puccinia triticina 1-1 BBBD Race 1]WAQ87506.1 hypothetical protein PtA15_8A410 [Puccinia triticina]